MRKSAATQFKARCLGLIDQVHDTGTPISITKRGKVVAVLHPAGQQHAKSWRPLRNTILKYEDPFGSAVDATEWDAVK